MSHVYAHVYGADGNPNGPDRICVTTQCLEASIDTWFNGTYGAGLRWDAMVSFRPLFVAAPPPRVVLTCLATPGPQTVVNYHKALFAHTAIGGSTGNDFMGNMMDEWQRSRQHLEDRAYLSGYSLSCVSPHVRLLFTHASPQHPRWPCPGTRRTCCCT